MIHYAIKTMLSLSLIASIAVTAIPTAALGGSEGDLSSPKNLLAARSDWSGTPMERMSPEERKRIRKNYEKFKTLPPQERERIRQNFREWRQLPPEKQQRLREQYRKMDPPTPPVNPDRFRN